MRDHSHHIELSRDQAVNAMLEKLRGSGLIENYMNNVERVAVNESYGRTLAQEVCAKTDLPNTLTCALDSIAVHWADFEGLPDGECPDTTQWQRGIDWQFANTGVAMPEGFDTAIVIENVEVSDDEQRVNILSVPSEQYAGTRAAGSNMHAGDVVVDRGCVITPDIAAQIVSAGWSSVDVLKQPRVAFLPTGDELVPANLPYSTTAPERYAGRGHVFESNSAVVRGKVEAWGGVLVPFDIIPDMRDAIKEALVQAMQVADIIVLNAGSSKGSDDWSVEVLEEMGEIICHQTNHGPGHHSSYAVLNCDGRLVPVVGISGPAGGASFTLEFYLRPIMQVLLGHDPCPQKLVCQLQGSFGPNKFAKKNEQEKLPGESRPPEATEPESQFYSVKFMKVRVDDRGILLATPLKGKAGSAATQDANALYLLPAGPSDVPPEEGDLIEVELRFGFKL